MRLATLSDAGIPLVRCCALIEETRDRRLRDTMRRIRGDLERGATFTEAVRARSRILPRFFIEMVAAGEASGALDAVFRHLAADYEAQLAHRRALTQAVTYPMCVVVAGMYVIPLFRMAMLGATPARMGTFLLRSLAGPVIALTLYSAAAHLVPARFSPPRTRSTIGQFSSIARKFDLANTLRAMAALYASGLSFPRSLERAAEISAGFRLRAALLNAVQAVRQGVTLSDALAQSRAIPRDTLNLIATGEQSGKLDTAIEKASVLLRDEAEHRLRLWLISLESLLIMLLGLAIVLGML